ncbi:MAG: hydrogenase nickel incorporation protein HypB [Planctomycetaceae bacterium]|nr:hydrogenase nickel incorporation protein HypB [Planctomycetaceae bacterium]
MTRILTIQRDLHAPARLAADEFRAALAARGTLVVNLFSSPGSGKTSLLVALAQHWQGARSAGVLVGDIATNRDAERLAPHLPAVQLTTGGACHLELALVQRGWQALDTPALDFLFVENVGNLICPAAHDLGEHLRVVVLSTTEGDDKPAKYPKAFTTSQALVISKIDLLPLVPFSVAAAVQDATALQPLLTTWPVSAQSGAGIAEFADYLCACRAQLLRETSHARA